MVKFTLAYLPASNDGLSFRGTEVAMFNYMHFAETMLGHKSILCLRKGSFNEPLVLKKFQSRFPVILSFVDVYDLENQLIEHKVDALYTIRAKPDTGILLKTIPMLIHCVYSMEPISYGLKCAGVSASVANNNADFIPHIVYVNDNNEDYRTILGIPRNARVFGRHGGNDTWDLSMAKEAVIRAITNCKDIYFIFAVRPYILQDFRHPRLICLEVFADLTVTRKFINTCDAMIHAQSLGETFGLSCAEFSTVNKPVITWAGGKVQEHLRILGDKCIKYSDSEELYTILSTFDPDKERLKDWRAYDDYTPEKVMLQFDRVFLDPLKAIN